MFRSSLLGSNLGSDICRQASRILGSGCSRPPHALSGNSPNASAFSGITGLVNRFKIDKQLQSSILGILGVKLCQLRMWENVTLPYALSFRSSIHYGNQTETEAGRMSTSMDYVHGLLYERRSGVIGRHALSQPQVESNADVVHVKLLRNNAFVTVTDSKGNKKFGTSAGKLAGRGGKLTRYSGDAAAEDIGRRVRQMKTKSIVMKVNGFTYFRRKKEAILSFKDGYSNSRGDMHPIVYIEDTTRKPHNGCRLPKKRRI